MVMTLPSSTMNITGFRTWWRGSSFGNESRIAASDEIARENAWPPRACHQRASLVEREVELEDVHAGLAEEPERAAVGVVVDQVLDVASGRWRTAATRRAWSCA